MQLRFNPPRHPLPSLSIAMKILTGFLLFTHHPSFFRFCIVVFFCRDCDSLILFVYQLSCNVTCPFSFFWCPKIISYRPFFSLHGPRSLYLISIFSFHVLCSLSVLMPLLIPKFGTQISLWKVHIDHSCMCR